MQRKPGLWLAVNGAFSVMGFCYSQAVFYSVFLIRHAGSSRQHGTVSSPTTHPGPSHQQHSAPPLFEEEEEKETSGRARRIPTQKPLSGEKKEEMPSPSPMKRLEREETSEAKKILEEKQKSSSGTQSSLGTQQSVDSSSSASLKVGNRAAETFVDGDGLPTNLQRKTPSLPPGSSPHAERQREIAKATSEGKNSPKLSVHSAPGAPGSIAERPDRALRGAGSTFFGPLFSYYRQKAKHKRLHPSKEHRHLGSSSLRYGGTSRSSVDSDGTIQSEPFSHKSESENPWNKLSQMPEDDKKYRRDALAFSNRKLYALRGPHRRYRNPNFGENPEEPFFLAPDQVAAEVLGNFVENRRSLLPETEREKRILAGRVDLATSFERQKDDLRDLVTQARLVLERLPVVVSDERLSRAVAANRDKVNADRRRELAMEKVMQKELEERRRDRQKARAMSAEDRIRESSQRIFPKEEDQDVDPEDRESEAQRKLDLKMETESRSKEEDIDEVSSEPSGKPSRRSLLEKIDTSEEEFETNGSSEKETDPTSKNLPFYLSLDPSAVFIDEALEAAAALRWLQAEANVANASNSSTTTTTTTWGCVPGCCENVEISVRILAEEYGFAIGLPQTKRDLWVSLAKQQCENVECVCEDLATWVETQCVFHVGSVISSTTEVGSYCGATGTRGLFERTYCPAACFPKDCDSDLGQECMRNCGDFLGCRCMNQLGSTLPPTCTGVTEMTGENCGLPPPQCTMHEQSVSKCSLYYFCPKNQCLIRDILCIPDDFCQGVGLCIPSTGLCTYPNLRKGTVCDDEIFYTFDDSCDGRGHCIGTENLCLKHNVQCNDGVPDCVYLPGECQTTTGRCVYQFRAQDTKCDDLRPYTVGDQCNNGLCVGQIVNLCDGADCTPPPWDTCHGVGVCNPSTGFCNYPALPNGQPCDDSLPDLSGRMPVCIDGVCVGDPFKGKPQYLTVGEGQCVDSLGKRMSAQQGDVGEEQNCQDMCTADNQCRGYSYAFPICTMFGTVRNKPEKDGWTFLKGDEPPALEIERVLAPTIGEPKFVCRAKDAVGDPAQTQMEIIGLVIGWFGFSVVGVCCLIYWFRVTVLEMIARGKAAMFGKLNEANEGVRQKYLTSTRGGGKKTVAPEQLDSESDMGGEIEDVAARPPSGGSGSGGSGSGSVSGTSSGEGEFEEGERQQETT